MTQSAEQATSRLLEIMRRLRDPEQGCPWDVEQTFASIAPYTIEEAYEVVEAIARADMNDLCEELGDLLLQVVFHAQMAQEQQLFNFTDVAKAISEKLIRRHPHVFAQEAQAISSEEVSAQWERIKAAEKPAATSLLDGVGSGMPAIVRALKLQRKAAKVGFDWNDPKAVLAKLREEIDEIEAAIEAGESARDEQEAELGDVLFCVVNLARHLHLDCDTALRRTNKKFIDRFRYIEDKQKSSGEDWTALDLETLESWWHEAKVELAR